MRIQLECHYCGHKWEDTVFNKSAIEGMRCRNGNCNDSNLTVRDLAAKVDYYQGCPPFPVKEDKFNYNYNRGYSD